MAADHDDVATLVAVYARAVQNGAVKKGGYVGTGKISWMSAVMSDTGWGRTKTARVMTMAQLSGQIVDGEISPSAVRGAVKVMPSYEPPTDWQGDEPAAEFPDLPSDEPAYEELKARQIEDFKRLDANRQAAKLIKVRVKVDGPFGIMAMGDPHVDAHGTDWPLLDRHTQIIKRTEGLFGANVGDITNNWVGRLARLYGDQNMGRRRALILAEGWLREVRWLWIDPGNHDLWSGADDPVRWITRFSGVHYKWQGSRLELVPPNGASVIINSRHDHPGYSMYHPTHGPLKASIWDGHADDIYTCGHIHTGGYMLHVNPRGKASHILRLSSYKVYDNHKDEKGFLDAHLPAGVFIINPLVAEQQGRVCFVADPELGADMLTFLRRHHAASKRVTV